MTHRTTRTLSRCPASIKRELREAMECVLTGHPLELSKEGRRWWRWMLKELTNAPMQYRSHPEQAISCEGREGNGKCGAHTGTRKRGAYDGRWRESKSRNHHQ